MIFISTGIVLGIGMLIGASTLMDGWMALTLRWRSVVIWRIDRLRVAAGPSDPCEAPRDGPCR